MQKLRVLVYLLNFKRKHTHTQRQQKQRKKKQDRILNVSKEKSNNNKGRNKFNETKIVVNTRVISNVVLLRFLILKYSFCEDERN